MDYLSNTKPFLTCNDYSVSKETFELVYNETYDLVITNNIPKNLDRYYESESYISHTDGKKGLFEKMYQLVKWYTLQKKLKLINNLKTAEKSILDIGAGTGDFLKICQQNNWDTFGVEPSEKARELAQKKNIDLCKNIEIIKNKKFDVITLWHVLEHIPNLDEYITQLKKLLKPKGVLLIAVPNFKSYDASYYKNFWAAYDVPRHIWHFSKKAIEKIFMQHQMRIFKILPMKFDSFYVALLSEKYKKGKMNPFRAIYIGFLSNMKAKRKKEYSSQIFLLKKE